MISIQGESNSNSTRRILPGIEVTQPLIPQRQFENDNNSSVSSEVSSSPPKSKRRLEGEIKTAGTSQATQSQKSSISLITPQLVDQKIEEYLNIMKNRNGIDETDDYP